MSLLSRLFPWKRVVGPSRKTRDVVVFATDTSGVINVLTGGANPLRIPPKNLIPGADAALQLKGSLVAYVRDQFGGAFDVQWREFLRRRFPRGTIRVYTAQTTATLYTVAVVFEDN